jgi:hypothetical protein
VFRVNEPWSLTESVAGYQKIFVRRRAPLAMAGFNPAILAMF